MNQDNDKNRNSNWNSFILIQDFPEKYLFILLVRILVALNRIDGLFAARKRKDPIGIIWISDSCFGVPSKATRKQGLQTFRDVQAVSNLLLLILNKLNAVKVGLTFGSYLLLQTR